MPDMDKISRGEAIALIRGLAGSGGGGSGITDVQINGTSIVSGGVANVPIGSNSQLGVIRTHLNTFSYDAEGRLYIDAASTSQIKEGNNSWKPIMSNGVKAAAFYGMAKAAGDSTQSSSSNAVGTYTESAKSAISTMLTAPESVTGTTPTITALAGVQYVCGEVSTLDITLPASGCVDVRFESGSTPTVLTITPPTGTTVKWAGGFDPTSLEANTVYEINVCDGLGVAASWT